MPKILKQNHETGVVDLILSTLEDEGIGVEDAILALTAVITELAILTSDPEQVLDEVAGLLEIKAWSEDEPL